MATAVQSDLVQVQFRDRRYDGYSGRAYTYIADYPVKVGDILTVETANGEGEARVIRVNVPEHELPAFLTRDKLRHITVPSTPAGEVFAEFFNTGAEV